MSNRLHYFDHAQNPYAYLYSADPVRPGIAHWERFAHNRGMFVLAENDAIGRAKAVCFCIFGACIPRNEQELLADYDFDSFDVAVFYTVYSLSKEKGVGREIINKALNHIRWFKPNIKTVMTLSPMTDMAKNFHLSNGATTFRVNEDTVNYEYKL